MRSRFMQVETMMSNKRSYSELKSLSTFEEKLAYLKLFGNVGSDVFGFDRYINQKFYSSREWKNLRKQIILRDMACDLGVTGYDIIDSKSAVIHHINPITLEDFKSNPESLLDPDNLITTTIWTHKLIHYGNEDIVKVNLNRHAFDTCPWRK